MDDNTQEEKPTINEPGTFYNVPGSNRVRFFSSFKEQEDEMISYWASISPLQRMAHLHEMIIASFGLTKEDLANPVLSNKITFNTKG